MTTHVPYGPDLDPNNFDLDLLPEYDPDVDDATYFNSNPRPKREPKAKGPTRTEKKRRNRFGYHLGLMQVAYLSDNTKGVRSRYRTWCSSEENNNCSPPPAFHEILASFRDGTWVEKWLSPNADLQ